MNSDWNLIWIYWNGLHSGLFAHSYSIIPLGAETCCSTQYLFFFDNLFGVALLWLDGTRGERRQLRHSVTYTFTSLKPLLFLSSVWKCCRSGPDISKPLSDDICKPRFLMSTLNLSLKYVDVCRWGLNPKYGPTHSHATVSGVLFHHLQRHRVKISPNIQVNYPCYPFHLFQIAQLKLAFQSTI